MSSSSEEIQAATVAAAIRSKLTTDVTTQTAIYKKLEKAYDLYAGYGASEREQLKKLTWQYRKDPEEGAALMQVSVLRRKGLIGVNAAHATQDVLSMLYGWQKEHSLPERELRVLETQEPVQ